MVVLSGFEAVKDGLTHDPEALSGRPAIPSFKVLGDEKGKSCCKTGFFLTGHMNLGCCLAVCFQPQSMWNGEHSVHA